MGILWGSLAAPPEEILAFPNADKVLHFTSYFTFATLFLLAAVWRPGREAGRYPTSGKMAITSVVVLGAALEVIQGVVLARESEVLDAVANLGGALCGLSVWKLLRPTDA